MDCPRCLCELSPRTFDPVQVESCPRCGGMFLDRGELDRIAEPHEGDLEFSTLHDETFRHKDAYGPAPCPRCVDETMRKVEFNIYTGVILDYCKRCGAFWLDGKEMGRINEEVRTLSEASADRAAPAMLWFAHFIWSLPR